MTITRAALLGPFLLCPSLTLGSALIDVPDRIDHYYDATRNILYISTLNGQIQRYDLRRKRLLAPFHVGVDLNEMDMTPDGASIYVTEYAFGTNASMLHKVAADTGAVTNIPFDRWYDESGSVDVSIGAYGLGLMTTDYYGSGSAPLRTLHLSSDRLAQRQDINPPNHTISERTHLTRSADRSIIFLQESNTSAGPIHVYDAVSNRFTAHADTSVFLDDSFAAVSADGSLIAMEMPSWISVFDRSIHLVEVLNIASGGLLFDPVRDRLLIADYAADQIVAYDTHTWFVIGRWDIGEDIRASSTITYEGVMSSMSEGQVVFLSTRSGVRAVAVEPQSPAAWLAATVNAVWQPLDGGALAR